MNLGRKPLRYPLLWNYVLVVSGLAAMGLFFVFLMLKRNVMPVSIGAFAYTVVFCFVFFRWGRSK